MSTIEFKDATEEQKAALWNVARDFIRKQRISCSDAVCGDRVYENAPDLVGDLGDIVGYAWDSEAEDYEK